MIPETIASNTKRNGGKHPSLAYFFLSRYVISLIVTTLLMLLAVYWLLYNTQRDAIELSRESTEKFLVNSVLFQTQNYEFESLRRSLEAFLVSLHFGRIEIVGPYGKTIADAGKEFPSLPPDLVVPITSNEGASFGEIHIWYGDNQQIWSQDENFISAARFLASAVFFILLAGGYSVFFYLLLRRSFSEPLTKLIDHMTARQQWIIDKQSLYAGEIASRPETIPSALTLFQETRDLAKSYTSLERLWAQADQDRLMALRNEKNQRRILLNVLDLTRISIAFLQEDGRVECLGKPLDSPLLALFAASAFEKQKIEIMAFGHGLITRSLPSEEGVSNFSPLLEIEDKLARKWTLHSAIVSNRKAIILREVTQERNLELALSRNEKLRALGTLSSSIAHDFNNVIATMLTNIELIKDLSQEGEPIPPDLFESMTLAAESVAGRISGIRRVALEEATQLVSMSPRERLKEIEVFMAPTLGPNIQLSFEFHETRSIMCDKDEFESCIINLLVNAKQALNGRGEIILRTRNASKQDLNNAQLKLGAYLAIDVQDNGPGVPPEISDLVFDPFYSTRQLTQGTGLGLAQVQAFCARMGGGVFLDRHYKQGACFTLMLPIGNISTSSRAVMTTRPANRNILRAAEKPFVLVLDDNILLARSTALLLSRGGFQTEVFETLEELKKHRKTDRHFAFLLSDVHLPDNSFNDVIEFAQDTDKALLVAFYSGNDESLDNIRSQHPDIQTISKPFNKGQLMEFICLTMDMFRRESIALTQ